ncbi:hypothetical protein CXF72_14775 [Psychromonas sp. MB-3u-54]|nr:hypothetical protein CXF72_14775 [Psychromonas sp. MB-3u-54]
MFELGALLLSAFILFMFGISVMSLTVIAVIIILSFILLGAISLIFKFGLWIIFAGAIYYFFFAKNKDS